MECSDARHPAVAGVKKGSDDIAKIGWLLIVALFSYL